MHSSFAHIAVAVSIHLLSGSPIVQAQTPSVVVVTEAAKETTITLSSGDRLIVRLPAQLGTGYSWGLVGKPASGLVRLIEDHIETSPQAAPGTVEIQVFTFEAIGSGSGELKLVYRQPWDSEQAPVRTYALQITVRSS
jgi:inhibitor of cysteine peptidase